MTMVDNAVYVDGLRTDNPKNLDETYEVMRERGGMAWIGLFRPTPEEIHQVAAEFALHALAVEDALSGHQRSKHQHIDLYVNDYSVDLGPQGRRAVRVLFDRAQQTGLIPAVRGELFLDRQIASPFRVAT